MNLPNLLTLLRIFFVPLLVAALVQEDVTVRIQDVVITNEWLALAIFLTAAATDLLDGYLARRWGQVTTIGTLLDPIADKLLVSAALISLVQVHAVPAWMVIVVVFAVLSAIGYFQKFWRKVDVRIKMRRRRELLRMERKRKLAALRRQGRSSPVEGASEVGDVGGVRGTT